METTEIFNHTIVRRPIFEQKSIQNIPDSIEGLIAFVQELYNNTKFREGVYIASQELYSEWEKAVKNNTLNESLAFSILKYYIRSFSSAVPFGLFSSHGINTNEKEEQSRYTYLDTVILYAFLRKINKEDIIRKSVLRLNDTIYEVGNQYRYIETIITSGNVSYNISSIDRDDLIEMVLSNFGNKRFSYEDFRDFIFENIDHEGEESVFNYIIQLFDNKIIISDVNVALNKDEALDIFISFLKKGDTEAPLYQSLIKIKNILEQINENVFNEDFSLYELIYAELDSLGIPYDKSKTLCTNYIRTANLILPEDINEKLVDTVNVLSEITKKTRKIKVLEDFKIEFYKKYEEREISILELFDNDIGLLYGKKASEVEGYSDLVDDVEFGSKKDAKIASNNDSVTGFWERLFSERHSVINLKNHDLSAFGKKATQRGSYSLLTSIADGKVILKTAGGSSAVNLLARFSKGDQNILNACNQIIERENIHPEEVLPCEIHYISNIRAGNIMVKNVQRPYEINILSSGANGENIPLNDIYVKFLNNKFILFSKEKRKQIIPFFSTAFNYGTNPLPIMKFLGDLQYEYRPNGLDIDFGDLKPDRVSHTPRITYGNDIVLYRETWNIFAEKVSKNPKPQIAELKQYIEETSIPQYVILVSYNEDRMILDTTNIFCLELILNEIIKNKKVQLREFIGDINEDAFFNEVLFSVENTEREKSIVFYPPLEKVLYKETEKDVKRTFTLGDEWIFAKIYTSVYASDKLIKEIFPKIADQEYISKWFYIRYNDPEYHLRLRIQVSDLSKISNVLQAINEELNPLIESKLIWKVEFGNYVRELERYAFKNIDDSESLFYHDSVFVSKLLKEFDTTDASIWPYVLKSVDHLYDRFEVSLEERHIQTKSLFERFWREFGEDKYYKKVIDTKFRDLKAEIMNVVMNDNVPESISYIFNYRKNSLEKISFSNLKKPYHSGLIDSYIHMNINRIAKTKPRHHELILYGLLEKYYRMAIGIKNHNKTNKNEIYSTT